MDTELIDQDDHLNPARPLWVACIRSDCQAFAIGPFFRRSTAAAEADEPLCDRPHLIAPWDGVPQMLTVHPDGTKVLCDREWALIGDWWETHEATRDAMVERLSRMDRTARDFTPLWEAEPYV